MICNIECLILEKEIKELTLECKDNEAQALGLPPYHQASEWATGLNPVATNTPCDEPSSSEQELPTETAAVETRAMRKETSSGAEPASPLHQHAAHIEERGRTSAGTNTVCSFCNTVVKHRSDRCLLKTVIGNQIKVDNQQALDSISKDLAMPQESQALQIVPWMQNNQDITKPYIHCVQNCPG